MRIIICLFAISISNFHLYAQEFELVKSVSIQKATEVSKDRGGNIYYATFNGDVRRINNSLGNDEVFSPPNPNTAQILDAWQGLRIFTFHRDLQQYRLINRNLSLHEDYNFPGDLIGFVELATPSFDNNIWLIDQSEFSLKKYQIHTNQILSNTPLDLMLDLSDYEILHMREYQNRVFVSTRKVGILIFDNFGNYIRTFEYPGIEHFSFWTNDLYFIDDGKLIKIDLYSDEIATKKLPSDKSWSFVLIGDNLTYLFSEKSIHLYK